MVTDTTGAYHRQNLLSNSSNSRREEWHATKIVKMRKISQRNLFWILTAQLNLEKNVKRTFNTTFETDIIECLKSSVRTLLKQRGSSLAFVNATVFLNPVNTGLPPLPDTASFRLLNAFVSCLSFHLVDLCFSQPCVLHAWVRLTAASLS